MERTPSFRRRRPPVAGAVPILTSTLVCITCIGTSSLEGSKRRISSLKRSGEDRKMAQAAGGMAVGSGLYLRKATGLVREVNRWDAVVLNLFFINIPLGVLLITQAPVIWPGVDMVLGM